MVGAGEGRAAERQHGAQILDAGIRLRQREQPAAPVRGPGRCHGDNRKPTVRAVDDSVCHRTRHHLDHAIVQDAPKRRRGMDRSFESTSYMFTVRRGGLFSGTPVPLALTEDVG